jgi:hypothetical protein
VLRSSHGSRRATPWATAHKPRPLPRVVRLGRAANDNARQPDIKVKLLMTGLAIALATVALTGWLT